MEISTITSKGQMTIPVEFRRQLGLDAGDRLSCFVEDDRLIIIPARGSLSRLKGIVSKPKRAYTVEEMENAVLDEAAARQSEDS